VAVAIERYLLAVGVTVLAFVILRVMGFFEVKCLPPVKPKGP